MSSKICDHTTVGMFVWKDDKLLLIERGKPPYGFEVPAGHVDGDTTFEDAAERELREEVGLNTSELTLVAEGRKENKCRREGGSWHYWKLYKVEVNGDMDRSLDETKQARWFSIDEIKKFAKRTEQYLAGKISEKEWENDPGLETVMHEWFKELKII